MSNAGDVIKTLHKNPGQQHLLFIKILVFYMQTGLLYYFLSSSNFSLFERKVTKEANQLRQLDRLF